MSMSVEEQIRLNILESITKNVQASKDAIVAQAVRDFEKACRQIVANISLNVLNYFTMERVGPELVIRVQIEAPEKK